MTIGIQEVKEANKKLNESVEKTLLTMNSLEIADAVHFLGDKEALYTLVRGQWVETFKNLYIMLLDDTAHCGFCPSAQKKRCEAGCTRVLVETKGGEVVVPAHYHSFNETVYVIKGTFFESLNGNQMITGMDSQFAFFPAGTKHQTTLNGLFLVCWSPPLTRKCKKEFEFSC